MNTIFEDPSELNGIKPTDYLSGFGVEFDILAFKDTDIGKPSTVDVRTIHCNASSLSNANLSVNNIKRRHIQIVPKSSNCFIEKIEDRTGSLKPIKVRNGKSVMINLEDTYHNYQANQAFQWFATTISYSGASRAETEIIITF
jgi:hypothetical protein